MKRFFRTVFALKSLLFGLLILGAWARSYLVADSFRKGGETQFVELQSTRGGVIVTFGHDGKRTDFRGKWTHEKSGDPKVTLAEAGFGATPWNRLGFGYSREIISVPFDGMIVRLMLPHWLVFLLAIPSALLWLVRRLRKPAVPVSVAICCPRCGQMLPSVPPNCPVCGELLAAPQFR